MPRYQVADLAIDSTIRLPCVPSAPVGGAAWTFVVDRHSAFPVQSWYHHERLPGGGRWRSLGRAGTCQVIHFCRRASFAVSFETRSVTCRPRESTSLETIRHLFLGHVVPLLLAEQGALALHASAVKTAEGIVAFVAPAGGGKSTLAMMLGARGCSIVADDCVVVNIEDGACQVQPLDVGLRLWPESLRLLTPRRHRANRHPRIDRRKTRMRPAALGLRIHPRRDPLHRVYLLEQRRGFQRPAIEPVPRSDAVVALMLAAFQLGMDEPARLRRSFNLLTTLVRQLRVSRLVVPADLRLVPAAVDAVLGDSTPA
jgi:hypothetical protein